MNKKIQEFQNVNDTELSTEGIAQQGGIDFMAVLLEFMAKVESERPNRDEVLAMINETVPASIMDLDTNETRSAGLSLEGAKTVILPKDRETAVWGDMPTAGSTGVDLSEFNFGIKEINGQYVTVNSGYVFHGEREAVVANEASLSIGSSGYIYCKYTIGEEISDPRSATIEFSNSMPMSASATAITILYYMTVSGGSAVMTRIHHVGDINIYGMWA